MLFQGFPAFARGQRRSAFLPGIAHQSIARIAHGLFRRGREQDRLPALILIDVKRPLVQTLLWGTPERDGILLRRVSQAQTTQSRNKSYTFQEISAMDGHGVLCGTGSRTSYIDCSVANKCLVARLVTQTATESRRLRIISNSFFILFISCFRLPS